MLLSPNKTVPGAYHRDTSCDQSTFIANQQQQQPQPEQQQQRGVPAATQVQEGAAGDDKDTEAYKIKRAQFSLQVGLLPLHAHGGDFDNAHVI